MTPLCRCGQPVAAPGGRPMTKCARCLCGGVLLDKYAAQQAATAALPELVVPAGCWGFRVPGLPVSWNNALIRPAGRRAFLSDKARGWKQAIAAEALRARPSRWPLDASYTMDLHCVFANPRADRDGPLKLVQDALEGVAWANDSRVLGGRTTKAVDAKAPRIEVVVGLAIGRGA